MTIPEELKIVRASVTLVSQRIAQYQEKTGSREATEPEAILLQALDDSMEALNRTITVLQAIMAVFIKLGEGKT